MATLVRPLLHLFEHSTNLYHAEADVLSADLEQPLHDKVRPRAQVKLYERGDGSFYQFKYAEPFHLEGIISYESGYTQVAGSRSSKPGHGFATLATSVVENLNVLDVLTADRVVGRISTEHPLDGQVPSVTFLGTRFENLKIAGQKVGVIPNLEILGAKPADDRSYLDEQSVTDRLRRQYEKISQAEGLPDWVCDDYLQDRIPGQKPHEAHCSLVDSVKDYPNSFGHVIDVPHFGKIFLGELKVSREPDPDKPDYYYYTFHLNMIRLKLGCPVEGNINVGTLESNGGGSTGPHPSPAPAPVPQPANKK